MSVERQIQRFEHGVYEETDDVYKRQKTDWLFGMAMAFKTTGMAKEWKLAHEAYMRACDHILKSHGVIEL